VSPAKVDNPRYYTITLRVSAEERERLKHDQKFLTLSQYLRLQLFGYTDDR
jgi:hypothetical protein